MTRKATLREQIATLLRIQDAAEHEMVRLIDALEEIVRAHRVTNTFTRECAWCGGDYDTHHADCPLVIARRALAEEMATTAPATKEIE